MSKQYVLLEMEAPLAIVTIDNPPVNPLNKDVMDQLRDTFTLLSDHSEIRAVILTGGGEKAFVAGADITEFPSWTPDIAEDYTERGQRIFSKIENFPCPVIAAINGYALGGGLELALACDIRIASENARLGLPEVGLGIIPGYGGTQRLCETISMGEAKKMIFTGQPIDAQRAFAIGLVQQVTALSDLVPEARKIARAIANNGPVAIREAKASMNFQRNTWIASGLARELQGARTVFGSKDKAEGVAAFLEKRTAKFTNQ
jgi:enoyl-CoA hydratase